MIRRRHIKHLISAYIDGDLSPARARAVAAHLEECPACALELEQWRAVLRLVSHHAAVSCPIDCSEAVLQRLQATSAPVVQRGRAARPVWALIPALTLMLTIAGGGAWRWAAHDVARSGLARPERIDDAGSSARSNSLAAPVNVAWKMSPQGVAQPPSAAARLTPAVVPVHEPVRLEEAFGRSDSLILASDFAEDDR